jgi:site-specific DNA-methyltransferase (adenine-specific)
MNKKLMFSSESMEWTTPQAFFDELNREFNFTLDPASSENNHKCKKYYTMNDDGLQQNWQGEVVFLNPPYGRTLRLWVEKAYIESRKPNTTVVMLIPARTDTSYFHDFILNKAEIRFLRGRLKFGGSKDSAPFPSMVVVYRRRYHAD